MTQIQIISLALVALLIFWAVGAYNRLVRLTNPIANAFGQIDVQLRRRYDLVAKLVQACKKYLSHERDTIEAVISARNQAKAASDAARSRPASAQAVVTLATAEQALTSSLGGLFAFNEAYPELQADQTIRELSQALTGIDNQVTFARQAFNDAVLDYNRARGQFPAVLIATTFRFEPAAMWQATESADERTELPSQMSER
jgi:LemA protein